jgi:hypothetical protein
MPRLKCLETFVCVEHKNVLPYEVVRLEYAHGEIEFAHRDVELAYLRSSAAEWNAVRSQNVHQFPLLGRHVHLAGHDSQGHHRIFGIGG